MSEEEHVSIDSYDDTGKIVPIERARKREEDHDIAITLTAAGVVVGQFWYDVGDEAFKFEGSTDESARLFVEAVAREFQNKLEELVK